ncbi:hypothetical protein AAC03nite_38190 [Alicyclobacillus acidoterrestris]|nr:hypothetical protein AAC03nite_38190 [Alicyclobacillus acidoterrestris]
MTPQQFIAAIAPSAMALMRQYKISAALTIAQAALESAWGSDAPGNNLFGVKADASWSGKTVTVSTKEFENGKEVTIQAQFRAYASIGDSLADHAKVLLEDRYKNLIGADYKTACSLIGKDGYATDPNYGTKLLEIINEYNLSQYDEEAKKVTTYPAVQAQVDSKPYLAVEAGSNYATYLIWTVARDTGCNLTKVAAGDVEIDGKKPPQVYDGKNTYIEWSAIPTIDAHPVKDAKGVWQFKTKAKAVQPTPAPAPVTHNYTMVVTEPATAVAGTWAPVTIQTLDNGQPLGHQIITITENGVQVCKDYTDDTTGGYEYDLQETTDKTDTMVFSWTDPAGKTHTITKTTQFSVPQASATPTPSDDSVVVTFPMLPDSDPNDAVYFNLTAPNGQQIKMQLDTGAFELLFTTQVAAQLNLANEGSVTIQGIGGTSGAYYSHATFSINGVQFTNVPCVVDESFQGLPLFGYRFFIDNGYDLLVSQKHNTITILK